MGQSRMPRHVFLLLTLAVTLMTAHWCSGQVTFSRDWNAGKRAGPAGGLEMECKGSAKSTAAVCHMLLDELRQLVSCESRALMRLLQAEDIENNPGPIFTGRR